MVTMKREDYNQLIQYGKKGLPFEVCGLIGGCLKDGKKQVEKLYYLENIDHSREHFSMDVKEQLAAVKDMREHGWIPLGNFHTHPETPARPSGEDIRLAYDPQASYLILSLAQEEIPVLKSFRIQNGEVEQEPFDIV